MTGVPADPESGVKKALQAIQFEGANLQVKALSRMPASSRNGKSKACVPGFQVGCPKWLLSMQGQHTGPTAGVQRGPRFLRPSKDEGAASLASLRMKTRTGYHSV